MKMKMMLDQSLRAPAQMASEHAAALPDARRTQEYADFLRSEMERSPVGNTSLCQWLPYPLDQPVVSEGASAFQNQRRLEPHEWVELLEQTECLEYLSPDVEACMAQHQQLEGNQELDLTGREFLDSPAIPMLPPLNTLPVAYSEGLMAIAQPQHDAPRRPGLREQFPRQQSLMEKPQMQFPRNYFITTERQVGTDKTAKRRTTVTTSNAENVPPRAANRSLKFDRAPQQASRRKRASWCGPLSRPGTGATPRRQCKSARKSKDCSIPGCTKGARSKGLCKRHGGGKRCTHPECCRSDQGGGFCIAHGGGKRCATDGCKNSAQSRGLCKSHGGGKRCRADGCFKSSQEGGMCRGHGSGRPGKALRGLQQP